MKDKKSKKEKRRQSEMNPADDGSPAVDYTFQIQQECGLIEGGDTPRDGEYAVEYGGPSRNARPRNQKV